VRTPRVGSEVAVPPADLLDGESLLGFRFEPRDDLFELVPAFDPEMSKQRSRVGGEVPFRRWDRCEFVVGSGDFKDVVEEFGREEGEAVDLKGDNLSSAATSRTFRTARLTFKVSMFALVTSLGRFEGVEVRVFGLEMTEG